MSFQIGQLVVCIKQGKWNPSARLMPKAGDVLTIRNIYIGIDCEAYLQFEEIVNPALPNFEPPEPAFWSQRFRPVRKTDISIFTQMLAPNEHERV